MTRHRFPWSAHADSERSESRADNVTDCALITLICAALGATDPNSKCATNDFLCPGVEYGQER